jgi:Xaa-Pro aminopeptidase
MSGTAPTDPLDLLRDPPITLEPPDPEIPFPIEEYQRRLSVLRRAMSEDGLEVVLLFSPEAMCWLHGYALRWYKAGSPRVWRPLACTAVHVDHDDFMMFEGVEHAELLRRTSVSTNNRLLARESDDMLAFIVRELRAAGWTAARIGIERYSYIPNPAVSSELEAALTGAGATVVDATDAVRRVRRRKSPLEIACVEEAARVCDAALRAVDENVAVGMTELEVRSLMTSAMARAGGEDAALHELAVVGIGAGHAISGRRRIKQGDWLNVDPCGVVNRYHVNIARAYYFGELPEHYAELTRLVGGAFPVLCEAAKAGTSVRDVNRRLREYYKETGLWELKGDKWIGGYELGISFPPDWVGEWHFTVADEDPDGVFEDGMVTNFESIFQVPVIDTLVYGPEGARALSSVPYELVQVSR